MELVADRRRKRSEKVLVSCLIVSTTSVSPSYQPIESRCQKVLALGECGASRDAAHDLVA